MQEKFEIPSLRGMMQKSQILHPLPHPLTRLNNPKQIVLSLRHRSPRPKRQFRHRLQVQVVRGDQESGRLRGKESVESGNGGGEFFEFLWEGIRGRSVG